MKKLIGLLDKKYNNILVAKLCVDFPTFCMKKSILLLFCLISIFKYSQEYQFDYFIREKSEHQLPKKKVWSKEWFYNVKTDTKLNLESYNDKVIAVLYSEDYSLKHVFKVKKVGEQLNFIYKHSRKINQDYYPKIIYNGKEVFDIKKLDSLKYSFVVFKDSKRKKKVIEAVVNLETADFEYLDFRIDHIITREAEKQLKNLLHQNQKYIVRSVDYKYNSKYNRSNFFELIQKIDLTVEVPKVLKESTNWSDFED
ncbi:hypothetical protein [Chryseobacterium scophthalmum]|uniref:Uncharacterized protein n=1 Tax=Chryseobacterium scophthalmum TaxID=59733 RepID=A0A1N6FH88_9FLAO|nr:hypothetical protein [Chryseobacterium scophthalmum]SIN94629.1 hypothetical protein SAMN05421769_1303 [Chryseobacterium scophthalmum]